MPARRTMTAILLFVYALEALVEFYQFRSGDFEFSQALFFLALVVIGTASLFLGKGQPATPVLCLLLASMAALVSLAGPESTEWGQVLGATAGALLGFVWRALRWLFGFAFVHFALIFPIESRFVRQHPSRVFYIYIPFLFLLCRPVLGAELEGQMGFLSILAGLLLGFVILLRKYLFSLTPAEKNRLRVVLIGCLAGALPAALVVSSEILGMGDRSRAVQDLGLFMFPLFPLGLAGAVLIENFSEVGKWLQRALTYSMAASGIITAFFLCYWVTDLMPEMSDGTRLISSLVLALAFTYPLTRICGAYISTHFYVSEESEPLPEIGLRSFQPIEPNPYIAGNPVRAPEMFFGREEDFQFIRGRLYGEHQGCAIVLCGERRTGKTSILYQILNGRLGPDFLPVFVDMQGMVVRNDGELLDELAAKIRETVLQPEDFATARLPRKVETYLDFNRFLDAAIAITAQRRLVVLVDEYELIETKVNDGKLSAEIYGYFNSLLLRNPRLSLVLTGSKTLDASDVWTALLARSIYRKIGFLALRDAQELVCAPLRQRVFFAPGIVNELLRLSNGHPFYTQTLCQTMVEVLNDARSNLMHRKALEETVRRVLENPPPQLFYQWKTFSESEKVVQSALATSLKSCRAYHSSDRVEKLIRSLPGEFLRQLDATTIHMRFEELRQRAILDRDQTRYRFTMDLMRLWIQSEHNVWKVLSEVSDDGRNHGRGPEAAEDETKAGTP